MIQAGFRFNSGVFSVDYAVPCNWWICSSLLFCDIDNPLLYTSGKWYRSLQRLANLDSV